MKQPDSSQKLIQSLDADLKTSNNKFSQILYNTLGKMKVLQINREYHTGSTGKIAEDIHSYLLSQEIDSIVCYGRGPIYKEKSVFKLSSEFEAKIHSVLSLLTGKDFGYSYFATSKLIKIIKREHPDVVHIHCLNGHFVNVYRLLNFLKKCGIKTVITLHAEIMHTAGCEHAMNCGKWKRECNNCIVIKGKLSRLFRDDSKHCFRLIKKCYEGFNNLNIVGVSDWLTERAKQSGVFPVNGVKFFTVNNGTNFVDHINIEKFERPVILHVTPNFTHPLKGGKYVIELAKRHPEWNFIVIGSEKTETQLPSNIQLIGKITDRQILSNYYASADVTLLTSKRETFSMVCLESLICGTPVVGFKAGGPESVFFGEYVSFVKYGNVKELSRALSKFIHKKPNIDVLKIKAQFSKEKMAQSYLQIYSR